MNSLDLCGDFFAPMSSDLVDGLIGQYQDKRKHIEAMAGAVRSCDDVLNYFVLGFNREGKYGMAETVDQLFVVEKAVAFLNADYWNRALSLTDVRDYMPQKRRDEWNEQIKNPLGREVNKYRGEAGLPPLPEFEESTVRATLADLLSNRAKFFAERVDGIFRALSRNHVTNEPQGFSKRMIIGNVIEYGFPNSSRAGYINDLRTVIAKFMGRDEPPHHSTDPVIKAAMRKAGQWVSIDGGALRIRVYTGIGTAHLEVHPDMAWRLNAVLASIYPAAIPAEFRRKPVRTKKAKIVEVFNNPLPFAVVNLIARMEPSWDFSGVDDRHRERRVRIPNSLAFPFSSDDKHVVGAARNVLESIGGAWVKTKGGGHYQFDYCPGDVIDEIICSGQIPDQKSHQFYPTPEKLARIVVEKASEGAEPGMNWLEPSAGTGGIAEHVPEEAFLRCYEISQLHCKVLEAKGFTRPDRLVVCQDFLQMAAGYLGVKYDRIVMNPPFSEGRWRSHVEAAAKLLLPGGVLVAILPASAKNADLLPGFGCEWSRTYDNEFAGTSVSVVILTARFNKNNG